MIIIGKTKRRRSNSSSISSSVLLTLTAMTIGGRLITSTRLVVVVHSFSIQGLRHHRHRRPYHSTTFNYNALLGGRTDDASSSRIGRSYTTTNNDSHFGDKQRRSHEHIGENYVKEKKKNLLNSYSKSSISRLIATCRGGASNHQMRSTFSMVPFLLDLSSKALLAVAGVGVAFLSLLYLNQEKMLYIPHLDEEMPRSNSANPPGYQSPKEYDIPYEETWIPTDDDGIEIHTWLLLQDQKEDQKPTIVFFHGNAGNIGIRLPNAQQMYNLLDCNVLMVEYRGYGDSKDGPEGTALPAPVSKPSEDRLKRDAEVVVSYIQNHPKIDPSKILLFGRSLGGAVVFHVASKWQQQEQLNPPLAGIIVENTFTSIDEMASVIFPFIPSQIKGPFLKMNWDSKSISKTLYSTPILYLSGQQDEIVPLDQMKILYESSLKAGSSNSNLVVWHGIPNGKHNDTWLQGGKEYWDAMLKFIIQAMGSSA